ncbi:MAG: D-2-hydroxyacid dehydrogenase [Polyangiaceae bacterium]|nr:D-2-hydroxyacid dehydrogenase [Myxococcales bacterium]MCB9583994.1 D-2-hydroxyacid dehydrogenase [Polyangiaceae bacterium]MCB9607750.1 D-2-hydroxyacid dehydrogenase [Polyangiaceae bacterium]
MKPRLVVLDGHTLNPGDLSWSAFEDGVTLELHARSGDATVERAKGATLVLTNKEYLNRARLEQLPDLRYIGVLATGVNVVDLEAARERGIAVTNVPGYGAASVAQHVFALLLELSNRSYQHSIAARQGHWASCPDFCFTLASLPELEGKQLGIVGLGAIGARVARIATALGLRVAVADTQQSRPEVPGVDLRWLGLDELFETSHVVSLHCPLTPETRDLVDTKRLELMRPGAFLINSGRGHLLDEAALLGALERGDLGGAALDVLRKEPPPADHPLIAYAARAGDDARKTPLIITPHIAWATREARARLMDIAARNLKAFLRGERLNRVD